MTAPDSPLRTPTPTLGDSRFVDLPDGRILRFVVVGPDSPKLLTWDWSTRTWVAPDKPVPASALEEGRPMSASEIARLTSGSTPPQ
jgi:hypothetical protein